MAAIKVGADNNGLGYDLGETVRLTIEPTDDTDAAIDPSTISLSITLPDATTAGPFTYAASQVTRHAAYFATGDITYRYLYTTTQTGLHVATWTTTGTGTAKERQVFTVR